MKKIEFYRIYDILLYNLFNTSRNAIDIESDIHTVLLSTRKFYV